MGNRWSLLFEEDRVSGSESMLINVVIGTLNILVMLMIFLQSQLRLVRRQKKIIEHQKEDVEKLAELQRKMDALRLKNKQLESEKLKEELTFKKKDLLNFSIEIDSKRKFISDILERLHALPKSSEIREIIVYIKSQLQIDESQKVLQENINTINNEFLTILQREFPNLTKNERQICTLLRIQLTSKEIAIVKNISADSVKVMRHRLRKKMKVLPGTDLNIFLSNLT